MIVDRTSLGVGGTELSAMHQCRSRHHTATISPKVVLCVCVAGLTNLRELNLGGCEGLSSLSALANLSKLTRLNLSGCRLISGLRHLSGAPSVLLLRCNLHRVS